MGEPHGWGDPTASPPHHSPHPTQTDVPTRCSSHGAPQNALPCPLAEIPKDSYHPSWEIVVHSPGWASGYSKGRRITWKMIPRDAGRCHITKQALFLSSQHLPAPWVHPGEILSPFYEALGPLLSLQKINPFSLGICRGH